MPIMKKPNILLIVLDATRFDACSCYGRTKVCTTPALDFLAEEGIIYEQAFTAAPWTLPAMTSIFTGLYPGQTDIYTKRELESEFLTITQILEQNGYATFGISNNDWLSKDFGLQRGFHQMYKLWQLWQTQDDITNLSIVEIDRSNSQIARQAIRKVMQGNIVKNTINTAYYKFGRNRKDYGAARTKKPLTRWIAAQEKPWFAFVHFLEAHLQYKPPMKYAELFTHDKKRVKRMLNADQWRLSWRHNAGVDLLPEEDMQAWHDLYLAEVAYTDYHMGQIIDWLRHTEKLDDTVVIVTADHGESLGEHGLLSHSYSLHDPLIRIPLVIRYPNIFQNERNSHLVQSLDIFAAILDIIGINSPYNNASKSLLSATARSAVLSEYGMPIPPHAAAMARFDLKPSDLKHRQRALTAFRTKTHKLVVTSDNTKEVYNLMADPEELKDISFQNPDLTQDLFMQLKSYWSEHNIDGLIGPPLKHLKIDPEVEERLQDLGYLE